MFRRLRYLWTGIVFACGIAYGLAVLIFDLLSLLPFG